jgi:CubicO group peptidase (beta-lactamase class C family)
MRKEGQMKNVNVPRNHTCLTAILSFCLITVSLFAVPGCFASDLAQEIDEYLTAAAEVQKFSGSVLVAKDGEPVLSKGYGMADYELNVPNTPGTIFQIGSITKQFTAAAIMKLVDKGLLSVNDPISKYLQDYPKNTGDSVTIHHLLTHTSGIPDYTHDMSLMERRACEISTEEVLASFSDKPLDFRPGELFKYSNSGYYLLGLIIEKVSSQSYDAFLRENLFDPLGMLNTGYDFNRAIVPNRAAGYDLDSNGEIVNASYLHMSAPFAAGAIHSTTEDMLIWDQALFTDRILSQESRDKMFTPYMADCGYGWGVKNVLGHKVISHDGGTDGFAASFSRWVDDGFCVTIFSNNVSAPVPSIAYDLARIIFDKPYDIPVVRTPIDLDTSIYTDYIGVYEISPNKYRYVTSEDGRLFSQRGRGRKEILPEARDMFFFEFDHRITMTFVRNEHGEVIEHILHQIGQDGKATKLPKKQAAELLAALEPADVNPAIYDAYVGEYEMVEGFVFAITKENDRLFLRQTGLERVEIYPRSEIEFFLKVDDAQITFVRDESGKVNELILHKGSQDMRGKRVK